MAEEATQTVVTTNGGEQTAPQQNPSVTDSKPAESNGTQTTPAQTAETQPAKSTEQTLTIESYGNLGLTETEDVKINTELVDGFKKFALESGIKPEVASKIAKFHFDYEKKEADNFKLLQQKWNEENTKTYGDNLKNVQTNVGRVLAEFDKEGKFKQLLTLAGAEMAPATLAFLKAIGDKVLEKDSVNPNTNSVIAEEKELADYYNN